MNLEIKGRVISKKNSNHFWRGRVIKTKAWYSFEKDTLRQLDKYKPLNPMTGRIVATYAFYLKGNIDIDLSNATGSIDDLLEKARVIENDKYIVEHHCKKIAGNKDFYTEIILDNIY